MHFSYFLDNKCLLDSIQLNLSPATISLVTGIENINLNILAGIVAQLFPLKVQTELPQIQALLQPYSGKKIEGQHEGEEASKTNTIFVGQDPERHFFFAKVYEEMLAELLVSKAHSKQEVKLKLKPEPPKSKLENYFAAKLAAMGIDASFLLRRISSLSGGEKMKVALAIAFASSSKVDRYVLYGVVPWLDKYGRECLHKQLELLKKAGKSVLLIEHEIGFFLNRDNNRGNIIDEFFYFDGNKLASSSATLIKEKIYADYFQPPYVHDEKFAQALTGRQKTREKGGLDKIIEFVDVSLHQHPYYSIRRTNPLLENVSFELFAGENYLLVGNNGSGKSTLTQIIFRIIKADIGEINLIGKSVNDYDRHMLKKLICYISQNPLQQLILSTVGQYRKQLERIEKVQPNEENVISIGLDLLNTYFADLADDYPISLLSYLECKILVLISFITSHTKLIIFDEPTWGIDYVGRRVLIEILNKLANHLPFTLLVISHDLTLAPILNAEILWLNEGKLRRFNNAREFWQDESAEENFGDA